MDHAPKRVIHLNEKDVADRALPGRVVRPFVGREDGSESLSTGTVTFPSRTVSAAHVHTDAEEGLYVLDGQGQIVCDGESFALEPGSFVFIPPGVRHEIHNTGEGPIKFFYAFSPPIVIGSW
jgi:quercetin dioxygenase-like cupin family protein